MREYARARLEEPDVSWPKDGSSSSQGFLALEPAILTEVERRIKEVELRVRGAQGLYQEEMLEIRIAAKALGVLCDALGLGELVRVLGVGTGKPQFLLEFRASELGYETLLLKVYGRSRPGEGAVQAHWNQRGVSAAPVLLYDDFPVSWILMERVPGLVPILDTLPPDEQLELHSSLALLMSKAHAEPVHLPDSRRLENTVARHLRIVLEVLLRHGYAAAGPVGERAAELYGRGQSTTLHGDLATSNVLFRSPSDLTVVDCAAYVGDPAFDAARWIARAASAREEVKNTARFIEEVRHLWVERERQLSQRALDTFLGLELVMEAGVREIRKEERGLSWASFDSVTHALLQLGLDYLEGN